MTVFFKILLLDALIFSIPAVGFNPAPIQVTSDRNSLIQISSEGSETSANSSKNKLAVLLCPAQFCVPSDYDGLFDTLRGLENGPDIASCKVAPLPRTEWIKVAQSLPTKDYLDGNLPVYKTLSWYFDAIETALAEIFSEVGPDAKICLIGHSIGGWVARAYLGGLGKTSSAVERIAQGRFSSFITLGTPHSSPESALVDQTRGLLREVENASSCSSQALLDREIDVTCVGSKALSGRFLTTNVEELVALSSYLPLLGRLDSVKGDGIVPTDLAFMEAPARKVELDTCRLSGEKVRHAHVLPTPWNLLDGSSPSIALPEDFRWYGSEGVVEEWARYIT